MVINFEKLSIPMELYNNNVMKKQFLLERMEYGAPVCEVLFVAPERIICTSETEHVGEDEGEW